MTGNILPWCPKPDCFVWTPHFHDTTLVAPTGNPCRFDGWNDGNTYSCDLPAGHSGKHADMWDGWEW